MVQCGFVEKWAEQEEYIICRRNTISAGGARVNSISPIVSAALICFHSGRQFNVAWRGVQGGFSDEENEGEAQKHNLP